MTTEDEEALLEETEELRQRVSRFALGRTLTRGEFYVGLLQIGGGILAIPAIADLWLQFSEASLRTNPIQSASFGLGFLVALCYLMSIAAGVGLLLGHQWGRVMSLVIQLLHLPVFSIGGVAYFVVIGWNCMLSLWPSIGVRMFFGSRSSVSFGEQDGGVTLGFNLVAVIALWVIVSTFPDRDEGDLKPTTETKRHEARETIDD